MLKLSVNDTTGQTDIFIPRLLVKIALDGCFKTPWPLKYHLLQIPDFLEIQTIRLDPVHTDVTDHQHAELAFAFGLCTH